MILSMCIKHWMYVHRFSGWLSDTYVWLLFKFLSKMCACMTINLKFGVSQISWRGRLFMVISYYLHHALLSMPVFNSSSKTFQAFQSPFRVLNNALWAPNSWYSKLISSKKDFVKGVSNNSHLITQDRHLFLRTMGTYLWRCFMISTMSSMCISLLRRMPSGTQTINHKSQEASL